MAPYLNGDPGPEFGHFTGTNYWWGQVRNIDEYDVIRYSCWNIIEIRFTN